MMVLMSSEVACEHFIIQLLCSIANISALTADFDSCQLVVSKSDETKAYLVSTMLCNIWTELLPKSVWNVCACKCA